MGTRFFAALGGKLKQAFKPASTTQVLETAPPSRIIEIAVPQENTLSIFSTIDKDLKTAAGKFEAAYKKLWAAEPKIEQTIVTVISTLAPEVVAIAAITAGAPGATAANAIIEEIKADLATVQVVVVASGVANPTLKSTLQAVVSNLGSILAAADVKDPALVATVTKDVDSIVAGLQVVIAAL
jgi:hypothetical protein